MPPKKKTKKRKGKKKGVSAEKARAAMTESVQQIRLIPSVRGGTGRCRFVVNDEMCKCPRFIYGSGKSTCYKCSHAPLYHEKTLGDEEKDIDLLIDVVLTDKNKADTALLALEKMLETFRERELIRVKKAIIARVEEHQHNLRKQMAREAKEALAALAASKAEEGDSLSSTANAETGGDNATAGSEEAEAGDGVAVSGRPGGAKLVEEIAIPPPPSNESVTRIANLLDEATYEHHCDETLTRRSLLRDTALLQNTGDGTVMRLLEKVEQLLKPRQEKSGTKLVWNPSALRQVNRHPCSVEECDCKQFEYQRHFMPRKEKASSEEVVHVREKTLEEKIAEAVNEMEEDNMGEDMGPQTTGNGEEGGEEGGEGSEKTTAGNPAGEGEGNGGGAAGEETKSEEEVKRDNARLAKERLLSRVEKEKERMKEMNLPLLCLRCRHADMYHVKDDKQKKKGKSGRSRGRR